VCGGVFSRVICHDASGVVVGRPDRRRFIFWSDKKNRLHGAAFRNPNKGEQTVLECSGRYLSRLGASRFCMERNYIFVN